MTIAVCRIIKLSSSRMILTKMKDITPTPKEKKKRKKEKHNIYKFTTLVLIILPILHSEKVF